MAKSNKRKARLQKDLKRLITLVTGFEEEEENFPICLQYVESNVKYHRYLSPDSHKIHRTIDGLCEKFQVHSQGQKATDLRELTADFLDQPGLDGKSTGKTDVHYAMLSLLTSLAHAPTHVDFERKKPEVVPEEVDTFDWAGYLLEGEDLNFLSHASSESEDDEPLSGSDEDKEKDHKPKTVDFTKDCMPVDGEQNKSEKTGDSSDLSCTAPPQTVVDEYAELERTLVVEYWKGKNSEEAVAGSHAACNTFNDWKSYQQRLNPFQSFSNRVLLTESQVVRETLWMLSGRTELFVFPHDGQQFYLNPDVYVLHLTPESLANSLAPMMYRAQQVYALDTFVTDAVSHQCSWTSSGPNDSPPLQTYMAFASCISDFLNDFRAELLHIERQVMKQETNIPLSSLTSDLRPWLQKVGAVHKVVLHGITAASTPAGLAGQSTMAKPSLTENHEEEDVIRDDSNSNCRKATLLLDTLYDSVFESDLTAETDSGEMASLLLSMLIKSSRPLLQVISDWINNGVLYDTAAEFVLQRNKDVKSLDETFWEKAFVPSTLSTSVAESSSAVLKPDTKSSSTQNSSSDHVSLASGGQQGSTADPGGSTDTQPHHSADFVIAAGPKLLQPILREAILTGKSMEMLENLGRMKEALNIDSDIFKRPPSLYELFVEDLRESLAVLSNQEDSPLPSHGRSESLSKPNKHSNMDVHGIQVPSPDSPSQRGKTSGLTKDATIERQLDLPGLRDTLLTINFAALFNNPESTTGGRRVEPKCPSSAACELQPLMRLCGNSLYPQVSLRYRTVCSKLVSILKEEYNLMGCIHAMQRYYLMSSGEVMYDFYTPVFNKIESREFWRDCSLLEMFLNDAVEPVFPQDGARLSVEITGGSNSNQRSAINVTDCIHLKYNVPWPVDVVISGRCEQIYNDVFTFILQIKRAKFTLDQLRFDDLSREQAVPASARELIPEGGEIISRTSCIHQFHLLRFRLQYFVNSLHNYIMTRILHSTELEFGCQLDAAVDLDQIIHIHCQYVDAVHERCLLHPRLSVLRSTVLRILNLTLTFGTHWRQGVDFARGEAIQEIDSELTRCIHFLSSFLQTVIKRGSFPHLESLAFALVSSLQFKVDSGQSMS